ncbi:MAG: ATP phosphoribosyltransferase regulatory subunit [Rhodothalassiaceae bacterium]
MTGAAAVEDIRQRGLLPEGVHDALSPEAEQEAALTDDLMRGFAAYGYRRVAPPLVEFETSLTSLSGGSVTPNMFRLLDPVSNRMMALRSDITPQIARLAATRLAAAPRPLRLSYAGHVLRVRGSQLRPHRQFRQAGAELIGAASVQAEAEVIAMALETLRLIGLQGLVLDLTVSRFVPVLARALGLSAPAAEEVRLALDAKDVGRLQRLHGPARDSFTTVLRAAGPVSQALAQLDRLDLPEEARALIEEVAALAHALHTVVPDLPISLDPGEFRGFEYKTGIGFSVFAQGVRGTLARGGRYAVDHLDGREEPAVGFSVYLDSILQGLPRPAPRPLVFLPADSQDGSRLRVSGWRTLTALAPVADEQAEARRMGCTHWLPAGADAPVPLDR